MNDEGQNVTHSSDLPSLVKIPKELFFPKTSYLRLGLLGILNRAMLPDQLFQESNTTNPIFVDVRK